MGQGRQQATSTRSTRNEPLTLAILGIHAHGESCASCTYTSQRVRTALCAVVAQQFLGTSCARVSERSELEPT